MFFSKRCIHLVASEVARMYPMETKIANENHGPIFLYGTEYVNILAEIYIHIYIL